MVKIIWNYSWNVISDDYKKMVSQWTTMWITWKVEINFKKNYIKKGKSVKNTLTIVPL